MNNALDKDARLKLLLAVLLKYGTWVASFVIGLGLMLALAETHFNVHLEAMRIVSFGIACLIFLPILRVILMLVDFTWKRDYLFVAIAGIVLLTILTGLAVGAHMAKSAPQSSAVAMATEQQAQ